MRFLGRLYAWFRDRPGTEIAVGLVLFLGSSFLAVGMGFKYFYSTFVLGLFLLFDGISARLGYGPIIDPLVSRVSLRGIGLVMLYIFYTDLIAGQIVFRAWAYPAYYSWANWLMLYLIIYPVGGLSLGAMFRVYKSIFRLLVRDESWLAVGPQRLREIEGRVLGWVRFLAAPVFAGPVVLYLLGHIRWITGNPAIFGSYVLLAGFVWVLFFDLITYGIRGQTLLSDLLTGHKKVILAILATGLTGALVHEVINTYAYEWRYLVAQFPVTDQAFLGVPIDVWVGWVFMTAMCVGAFRMVRALRSYEVARAGS